jgi:hypothetical protein
VKDWQSRVLPKKRGPPDVGKAFSGRRARRGADACKLISYGDDEHFAERGEKRCFNAGFDGRKRSVAQGLPLGFRRLSQMGTGHWTRPVHGAQVLAEQLGHPPLPMVLI